MNALIISLVVFAVLMAGALVGAALQKALPKHHLSDDSKDMVKIGAGFIATLAALVEDLMQTRWLLIEQSTAAVSTPMLVIMVVWPATIAGCLAVYAPRNGTVLTVAILCALSAAGAIFLIAEMYEPFSGLMKISDAPVRMAIYYLSL